MASSAISVVALGQYSCQRGLLISCAISRTQRLQIVEGCGLGPCDLIAVKIKRRHAAQ
jgi:hypothetical protein